MPQNDLRNPAYDGPDGIFAGYGEEDPLPVKEFALTDEQVDNWRQLLVTMPLPPFRLALGAYALIMPRQQLVDVVYRLKELIEEGLFD